MDIITVFLQRMITFFETNSIITFIIFIIALFVLYKLIRLLMRILIIVAIGAAFPFIMNYFLNWGISITLESIIFYATAAAIIYLFAIFVKGILNIFKKILGPIAERRKEKKLKNEIEKDIERGD